MVYEIDTDFVIFESLQRSAVDRFRLCEVLGLDFSDRMVNGWGGEFTNVNVGSSRFKTEDNDWTKDVARANGFHRPERAPLQLDALPEPVRSHILNVAMPVYDKMKSAAL